MKKFFLLSLVLLAVTLLIPLKENQTLINVQNDVRSKVQQVMNQDSSVKNNALKTPKDQDFAINNIQMNMSKGKVERQLGQPKRITSNEYGTKWYAYYNNDYENFIMVSYIDNKVNALYSNQNVITSKSKVKYNTPKDVVKERLGKPLKEMVKGRFRIDISSDEYDVFHKDNIYTTVFYDKHNDNGVTALLQVSDAMEKRLTQHYGAPSSTLEQSFEYQNYDLVNAERKQHGLNTLSYAKDVSNTARKHSEDMVKQNYFDHNNLDGASPFDRLKADNIDFNAAGENLAYGQQNSIFAHEGLMNSLGHRKNILNSNFKTLGVGVDFNDERQPYWTENYTG
ncbi:CAP domain-containing protein [Staphylococcus sp. 51-48]|nr:CAP domain-containing protein [Staphylococcus borealis]